MHIDLQDYYEKLKGEGIEPILEREVNYQRLIKAKIKWDKRPLDPPTLKMQVVIKDALDVFKNELNYKEFRSWWEKKAVGIPSSFGLTSPPNGATKQVTSGILSWQASTGASNYDVYLGTTNPPTTVVSSAHTGTTYSYTELQNRRKYYWKVVAHNVAGTTDAAGSPWCFTTKEKRKDIVKWISSHPRVVKPIGSLLIVVLLILAYPTVKKLFDNNPPPTPVRKITNIDEALRAVHSPAPIYGKVIEAADLLRDSLNNPRAGEGLSRATEIFVRWGESAPNDNEARRCFEFALKYDQGDRRSEILEKLSKIRTYGE
jgi:hypothetical protein